MQEEKKRTKEEIYGCGERGYADSWGEGRKCRGQVKMEVMIRCCGSSKKGRCQAKWKKKKDCVYITYCKN